MFCESTDYADVCKSTALPEVDDGDYVRWGEYVMGQDVGDYIRVSEGRYLPKDCWSNVFGWVPTLVFWGDTEERLCEEDLHALPKQKYFVDNDEFRSQSVGLGYRRSPNLCDMPGNGPYAEWGSHVTGILLCPGWLRVGEGRYLPVHVDGQKTLKPATATEPRKPAQSSTAPVRKTCKPRASNPGRVLLILDETVEKPVNKLLQGAELRQLAKNIPKLRRHALTCI
jgi:hypothetical protein